MQVQENFQQAFKNLFSSFLESLTKLNIIVFYILVAGALITSVLSSIGNPSHNDNEWASGWLQNFSTEMYGAVITFALFELVVGAQQRKKDKEEAGQSEIRAKQEADERSKQQAQALNEMRDAVTTTISEELHGVRESLEASIKSTIKDEFRRSNQANAIGQLELADTKEARQPILNMMMKLDLLNDTDLTGANLTDAWLTDANMEGTVLGEVTLIRAHLIKANLLGADLALADLQSATLISADLRGASLMEANLEGADLRGAIYDSETILPDNTRWKFLTEMTRFTDPSYSNPNNPDPTMRTFWRSDFPESPAYSDDSDGSE